MPLPWTKGLRALLILAIDTSCATAQAALTENGVVLCELALQDKKTHSVKLLPMIDLLFQLSGRSLAEVELIAVVSGPGSFTGLRIGVSTVKMLAFARQIPVMGINTLDYLAAVVNRSQEGIVCPILDARNETVYYSLYQYGERIAPYGAEAVSILCDTFGAVFLNQPDKPVWFCGDGVLRYRDLLMRHLGNRFREVPAECLLGRASGAARLAWERMQAGREHGIPASDLEIFYLRKPQAERMLEQTKEQQEAKTNACFASWKAEEDRRNNHGN